MIEGAVPPPMARPGASSAGEPRWALVVAILGSSLAFLDGTVVNVALPIIQERLGATAAEVQWVMESYSVFLASLVLVGGALGDRLGRKRVFTFGVGLFGLASIACGLAPGPTALIVARGIQGIGAAMLVPGSLALISAAYPEKIRGRAIGTWSAFSTMMAALGPVLGGWVVGHASWRWIFFFNPPIAVAVLLLSRRVDETRDENAPREMDWLGAGLATAGLGLIVYALLGSASAGGIARPRTLVLLGVGIALLVVFVAVEARRPFAMVPLSLFRRRTFAGANMLTLLLYAALGGSLFFVPFNLIQVQGYSPAAAGAAFLPFVLLLSLMSRWAGGLVARHGARTPLVLGPLVAAAGFALFALPGTGGSYWTTFFPGIVVLGLGMGVTVAPLTTAVMGAVDAERSGVASGINNAVSRAAGLLAIAVLGVVMLWRFNDVLDDRLSALPLLPEVRQMIDDQRTRLAGAVVPRDLDPELRQAITRAINDAYVAGFRVLMTLSAGLAALGALAAFCWIAPKTRGEVTSAK